MALIGEVPATPPVDEKVGMINPDATYVSDAEKLSIVRMLVDSQTAFGTDMANFKRILLVVLDKL